MSTAPGRARRLFFASQNAFRTDDYEEISVMHKPPTERFFR